MAGTKIGGQKTKKTVIERYGEDYYKNMGQLGGKRKVPKGFAANRERARLAGIKGGSKGRGVKKPRQGVENSSK